MFCEESGATRISVGVTKGCVDVAVGQPNQLIDYAHAPERLAQGRIRVDDGGHQENALYLERKGEEGKEKEGEEGQREGKERKVRGKGTRGRET